MSGIWIVTAGICTALVFGRLLPAVLSRFLPIERAAGTAPVGSPSDFHGRQEMQPAPSTKVGELAKMLVPTFAVICVMFAMMNRQRPAHDSLNGANVAMVSPTAKDGAKAGSSVKGSSSGGPISPADSAHAGSSHSELEDQVKMLQSQIASLQSQQVRQAEMVKSLKRQAQPSLPVLVSNLTGVSREVVPMLAEPEASGKGGTSFRWDSQSVQQALNATHVVVAGTHVILPENQSPWRRQDPWNYITSSIDGFKIYPGTGYFANSVALYDPCSLASGRSTIDGQYVTCPSRPPQGIH